MLTYDIQKMPFSKGGSFLKISPAGSKSGRVQIGTARKRAQKVERYTFWPHDFYEIAFYRGSAEVTYTAAVTATHLTLTAEGGGTATVAFLDDDTLLMETDGLNLRLLPCHAVPWALQPAPGEALVFDYPARAHHHLRTAEGTALAVVESLTASGEQGMFHDLPYTLACVGGDHVRLALRSTRQPGQWVEPLPAMADVIAARAAEIDEWMAGMPPAPARFRPAMEMAWFILWHCLAAPGDNFTRTPMLMSKNWMNQVWAWDNCFDALALAKAQPKLAWEQLFLMFDQQAENGMLPDSVNDLESVYGFMKPPVYGWTIMKLVQAQGLENCRDYLAEAYGKMAKLTAWWYTYRDNDQDGMCQYHHGNDSGWDNSTMFDQGYPTEGSDLAAHLVLQQEGLAMMATALELPEEATQWHARGHAQLQRLLKQGVRDGHFFSPIDGANTAPPTQSLLNYIALVLGHRLPTDLRQSLVRDLAPGGPFLTDYGLATEAITSEKFEADGYWRGPIWAPSTYLIFDGLVDAGEIALAKTIAERFCALCAQDPYMYENYHARTGAGLRCPAYSWTAAVFALMAEWLVEQGDTQ